MSSRSQEDPERRFFEQNVNHSKEEKKKLAILESQLKRKEMLQSCDSLFRLF